VNVWSTILHRAAWQVNGPKSHAGALPALWYRDAALT
jgi:hypothetical protein